jgi:hypothetical protein
VPHKSGKERKLRRLLMVLTMALVMAAMMLAMAMPALAAKSTHTRAQCLEVQRAFVQGEKLSGQQKKLASQYSSLGDCIAASSG